MTTTSPAESNSTRLQGEGLKGLALVRREFGQYAGDAPPHLATLRRWCLKGVLLADGSRLRLEHVRVAGRLATSSAAVRRFIAAQQTELPPVGSDPTPRTPAARSRASKQAEAELIKSKC